MSQSEQADTYRDVIQKLHVGVYQTNNDDTITLANPAFAKLLGHTAADEIIGKDMKEFIVESARGEEFRNDLIEAGGSLTGYIVRMKAITGEVFYVSLDSQMLRSKKGEEIGIRGIVRRTPKGYVDQQRAIASRDRFMMYVSHELRTPMTTVLAAAENIQSGRTPLSDIPKALNKIVIELQRLDLLTERLWRAEAIARGLTVCDPSNVNVFEHLSICRKLMTPLADRRGITIELSEEIKQWPPLWLDPEMFRQAIVNLLDNAIKYSDEGSQVRVYGYQRPGERELMFQNVGIMIPDDEYDKVFELYHRSKHAIAMSPTGSGVGLALVQDFADKNGVKVRVKSVPFGSRGWFLNSFSLIFVR